MIAAQMVFTQYGTYYQYSWDIMEPICCLFGIFDMIAGYAYWLGNTKEFDYEIFEHNYIESKVSKEFQGVSGFNEDLHDIESMIQHMELYKTLLTEGLPEIIEALDHKFKPVGENSAASEDRKSVV